MTPPYALLSASAGLVAAWTWLAQVPAAESVTTDVLSTALLVGAITALFGTLGTVARGLHLSLVASLRASQEREIATKDEQVKQSRDMTMSILSAKDEAIRAHVETIAVLAGRADVLDARVVEIVRERQAEALAAHAAVEGVTHAVAALTESIHRMAAQSTEEHKMVLAAFGGNQTPSRKRAGGQT